MLLRPIFLVICVLFILLENHVSGSPNGGKCRRDSQCDSGNCCGVWPFKRCRECCKDSHCPTGQNCKNNECIAPRANGMSCVPDSDCISGHCCGVVPFKRCRECCKDSHCPANENNFCLDRECRDCLQENVFGCSSDSHCCGQLTCCGEKNIIGNIGKLLKGTCQDPNVSCCASSGQQCSTSSAAPENMKCCNGNCQVFNENSNFGTCV